MIQCPKCQSRDWSVKRCPLDPASDQFSCNLCGHDFRRYGSGAQRHAYALRYRPPSFTLPKGWTLAERGANTPEFSARTDVPVGRHRFGVIEYDRPLTAEERDTHELDLVH